MKLVYENYRTTKNNLQKILEVRRAAYYAIESIHYKGNAINEIYIYKHSDAIQLRPNKVRCYVDIPFKNLHELEPINIIKELPDRW